MKKAKAAKLSATSIAAALGSVSLPAAEIESFAQSLLTPHSHVLRLRRGIDPDQLDFATQPIDWYQLGRRTCDPTIKPSCALAYAGGDYYLQDAGSLLALAACGADLGDQNSPLLVCDLCAAPGGQASALLETLGEGGFLLANEPSQSRFAPLVYNLARTGSDRFAITNFDAAALADRLSGVFDLVLVDAPCSGQTLMSGGHQSGSALSERQIMHGTTRQRRILTAAVRLLRHGGRLIYSTSTFTEAENEQQVDCLIDEAVVATQSVESLAAYQSSNHSGCYRLWPHRHRCASSFAASLVVTQQPATRKRSWKRRKGDKSPADLLQWFDWDNENTRIKVNDAVVLGWPADAPDWVDDLALAGPELLHRTGQTWKPAHAAALRRVPRAACQATLDVDDQTAKQFLSGQPIACQSDGWQVVRHRQRPLGWIKGSHSTGNGCIGKNQLPPAAKMMGPWLA